MGAIGINSDESLQITSYSIKKRRLAATVLTSYQKMASLFVRQLNVNSMKVTQILHMYCSYKITHIITHFLLSQNLFKFLVAPNYYVCESIMSVFTLTLCMNHLVQMLELRSLLQSVATKRAKSSQLLEQRVPLCLHIWSSRYKSQCYQNLYY